MANPLMNYLRGAYDELRKVAWPTRKETTQHTLVVIGVSLGIAIFLGAIDYALNLGLEQLLLRR
jgi:preprotein translocase subunit SecE